MDVGSQEEFFEDLKKQGFIPEVIRYLLLNGHYRTKLNFSLSKRLEGEQAIQRIIEIYSKLKSFNKLPSLSLSRTSTDRYLCALVSE